MGFPLWTLWGMGITAAGTIIMLVLAYLAQSPRLLTRIGLAGYRLDLRARTFTGFALALVLLSAGFFLAGVPLGGLSGMATVEATQVAEGSEADMEEEVAGPIATEAVTVSGESETVDDGTPDSGAFGGPPPAARTETAVAVLAAGEGEADATATAVILPSATPTSTPTVTPSPTSSPTPTITPTPTNTPTPIFEETAMINTGSSTVWIKRIPGGQDLALVRGGDTVILFPGHANVAGAIWREVSTVEGTVGWVLESYLSLGNENGSGEGEA
jgi:hypothetical protein